MKDRCVRCKSETEYEEDVHIDFRYYYIEGVGQLCPKCHKEIYGT